ncbi:MAG: hypothetical protein KGQ28_06720, partial [Hyphomicrobiales bacterium]|nr:hypothetical protein [Hyphomicrobiales bacterium]
MSDDLAPPHLAPPNRAPSQPMPPSPPRGPEPAIVAPAPPAVPPIDRRVPLVRADAGREAADAMPFARLLGDLLVHRDAQTPLAVALDGAPGAGKSALGDRAIEVARAFAAKATPEGPFLHAVATATVDAAAVAERPAAGAAEALHAALGRVDTAGVAHGALADRLAAAGLDPRAAAEAADQKLEAVTQRLDAERQAQIDLNARRAGLVDALLAEGGGSRFDAFARARRPSIERRMRAAGQVQGEPLADFRRIVGEMAETKA